MQKLFNTLVAVGFAAGILLSCEKPKTYSDIPEIEFRDFRIFDTVVSGFNQRKVSISFSFVDGDGDIGYREDLVDSTKKDNLIFSRYEQRNGVLVNVDSLLVDSIKYSIPYNDIMKREGQNKTLKGTIRINLDELVINYDTIRYDFYIKDRAGHKSNVASTPEITGLKKP
jgi:hypothetical protein